MVSLNSTRLKPISQWTPQELFLLVIQDQSVQAEAPTCHGMGLRENLGKQQHRKPLNPVVYHDFPY